MSMKPARLATSRDDRDQGQVTAELAMGLPSLVAVVFLLLWMISAVSAQTRCAEAARLAARAAARGETPAATRAWALRAAPPDAVIDIEEVEGGVRVRVTATVGAGGAGAIAPAVTVSAFAVAAVEATARERER
ncbi:pilus assembly protein TadE [Parafrankia colletiae]|uniref:Pilus assembly protein TadE n=2 Tax=Parafrankia colletiae TaxID=573497 RepID=A0A1S1Q809_9ACTN|nr:pilus assembly protein TadE [Parafrankia colletiae]